MKYFILLFALISAPALAINCNVTDTTYQQLIKWTDPTFYQADGNGVEKPLPHTDIVAFELDWYDVKDKLAGCKILIQTHALNEFTINLEAGINYESVMRTVVSQGNTSSDSNMISFMTAGAPTDPTSPPLPAVNRITVVY